MSKEAAIINRGAIAFSPLGVFLLSKKVAFKKKKEA